MMNQIAVTLLKKTACAALGASICCSHAIAASILLTQFDSQTSGAGEAYAATPGAPENFDHPDTDAGAAFAEALATAQEGYDFLYRMGFTSIAYLNAEGVNTLGAFWSASLRLVDSDRDYGYNHPGASPPELALVHNSRQALDPSRGGERFTSDSDSRWTVSVDPELAALGFNPIVGAFVDPFKFRHSATVLLDNVPATDFWAVVQPVGVAPAGILPSGIQPLARLGLDTEDRLRFPYTSESFELGGSEVDR